ncbi:TRAP transporter large permease [Sedimentitalea todarodis]|uniref:TRAP transporter large permease protein n=1 Tax=Sedimentitalea todarodis TaxID=1631240 RepID=A0ABU3VLQ6_9RHOB|nr:TRAP transporter large permease [Sedimentitalea todarodis]MDU9007095.1 TRAP transporter large permease [Sedimentitalea todarodis]
MTAVFLFLLVFALLVLRQSVILILIVAAAYVHFFYGDAELTYLIDDIWTAVNRDVLLAVPMFILAGSIMTRGSISRRLIDIVRELTQWLPGGLAVATILSCAVFAAISGSSPVTLLAVGSILYPALLEHGYDKKFALGALASAGTLGIVIPPSIPLIFYAIVTENSISDLFLAGIIPGLILTFVLSLYSLIVNRHIAPIPFDVTTLAAALRNGIFAMLAPIILLGGIYSGYFSATEAAGVAVGYALIIELLIYRALKPADLFDLCVETARLLGTILPILAVASSINILLTVEQVPQNFAAWMSTVVSSKLAFLIVLNLFLLLVGCLIDIVSAILMLAPILLPVAAAYGINPIHFGIIMVVNLEIGYITPPIGLNLIVAMTAFKEKFLLICRSVLPFIALMIFVLILVVWVPGLSLVLLDG